MILSAKKGEGIGKRKRKEKYDYTAFIWLAPALIMMLIFCYYPPIYAAVLSFTDSTGGDTFNFIFFDNYIEIFSDRIFWLGMRNVVVFLIWGLISGNVAPLLLAELLFNTKSVKLSNTLRFLFIIPTLIPGVINMILWQFIILGPEPTSIEQPHRPLRSRSARLVLRLFAYSLDYLVQPDVHGISLPGRNLLPHLPGRGCRPSPKA